MILADLWLLRLDQNSYTTTSLSWSRVKKSYSTGSFSLHPPQPSTGEPHPPIFISPSVFQKSIVMTNIMQREDYSLVWSCKRCLSSTHSSPQLLTTLTEGPILILILLKRRFKNCFDLIVSLPHVLMLQIYRRISSYTNHFAAFVFCNQRQKKKLFSH